MRNFPITNCLIILSTIFATLKLLGLITWSWAIVLLPIWGSIVIGILLGAILVGWLLIKDNKKGKTGE